MAFRFPFGRKAAANKSAVTIRQVVRAYRQHFGHDAAEGSTLMEILSQLTTALGADAAMALCRKQSNDLTAEG